MDQKYPTQNNPSAILEIIHKHKQKHKQSMIVNHTLIHSFTDHLIAILWTRTNLHWSNVQITGHSPVFKIHKCFLDKNRKSVTCVAKVRLNAVKTTLPHGPDQSDSVPGDHLPLLLQDLKHVVKSQLLEDGWLMLIAKDIPQMLNWTDIKWACWPFHVGILLLL